MANEFNHIDKDSHILNAGIMGSGADWNSNVRRNSVLLLTNMGGTTNKPGAAGGYNGLGFYISSMGMGSTYDSSTAERAFQTYFTDYPEGGMHYRVRQGTSGWHRWKMMPNDYAFKEGPTSWSSSYTNVWSVGYDYGGSLDATSSTTGITINETGIYVVDSWQRSTGTDVYIGLGISGNRTTLESRSEGAWGHDHTSISNGWTHAKYVGLLNSGEKVTAGTPGSTSNVAFSTAGFTGGITIFRIS